MIRIEDCSYTFPGATTPALRQVNLDVDDGTFLLVAGASGSGKSTLARAVVGLVPHFHGGTFGGTVTVAGRDTRTHQPRALADVAGFVAQDPGAGSVATHVEDEICFAMENLGVAPTLMRKRLEETLDALAIAGLRDRPLETLSGGERQRVAIAAVLAAQPRVLVLDEPTSQLDPQSAEEVLGVLHRLNLDLGLAIVLVEHRLERVVQHADRMIVLDDGRIVSDGTPRAVLASGAAATPLSRLGRALGWEPLPLTVREGRAFASRARPAVRALPKQEVTGEPLVEARNLRVARGGEEVLRHVTLTVRRGEALAIAGRNGSGKTTLLRTLMGLQRPHGGARTIAGFDPARTPVEEIASRVAYVPQSADALLFHETVRDELAFTLRARAPRDDPDAWLARKGLEIFADMHPRDLSVGRRLRVAIAAATAGAPDVVLLDEPTRGMDASGKEQLSAQIEAWRAGGAAVVLVTHDVELIARAATRVALLAGGEIVVDGPVREVLGESALFSSQMNKVFGERSILTVEDALVAVGAR